MQARKYQEVTQFLYGLQRMGIKFGLDNIRRVLASLGDPHEGLAAIHIGGSNGKGSTAAHIESMLLQAGFRVGLYTSPHFIRFTERIRIGRVAISESEVVQWTEEILDAVPELRTAGSPESPLPITFFEFTTAMALCHFARHEVDFAILEVGMGGRLDATNVCRPLASAITTVSLEHQDYLGRTLGEIAGEKAGIIKPGVPVVSGVSHPRARRVVESRCAELGAPLFRLGREFRVQGTPSGFSYLGFREKRHGLRTSLRGRHQLRNAALALAVVDILRDRGVRVTEDAVRGGMEDVRWPGRQQWIPGPPQVLLDGAHNPGAMRTLCSSLGHEYRYERLRVLMGAMRDKDHRRMLSMLSPMVHEFVFCRPDMERSQDPWVLQSEARKLGCRATVTESVSQGFEDLMQRAGKEDLVCVTGSLFVVGEVLAHLEETACIAPFVDIK